MMKGQNFIFVGKLFPVFFFLIAFLCPASLHANPSPLEPPSLIFSPAGNGSRKTLSFVVNLPETAEVSSWRFEVREKGNKDVPGALVKAFSGDGRPPQKIIWDGKDTQNRVVEDGTYYYSLSLQTPAGNQAAIRLSPVIVDRVPPTISAKVHPRIFSPNGLKPETVFTLKASDQYGIYEWLLEIKGSDGVPVKSWMGKGRPPAAVRWDGRGDFNEDVPNGSYSFQLTVENLASNRAVTPPQTVTVKRQGVVSTVGVTPDVFSPHKEKPIASFDITGGDPSSVERWELKIINQAGRPIFSFKGNGAPPARLDWNGDISKDKTAPDGAYQVILYETDNAGNTAASAPEPLYVDTKPPLLEARLEPDLLSPGKNRENSQGIFKLRAQSRYPFKWALKIYTDVGEPVRTWSGKMGSKVPNQILWHGNNDSGQIVTDGTYSYSLWASDIAGNEGETPRQKFVVNTTPPALSVSTDHSLFSPNGDPALSHVVFSLSAQDASPFASWALLIKDSSGKLVREFTGSPLNIPASVSWNGKGKDREPLPDGTYSYVLEAKDIAGNSAKTSPQNIVIGATKPIPRVSSSLDAISPNADGFKDTTDFHLSVKSFNPLKKWSLRIFDQDKVARRIFEGEGDVPGTIQWGGEGDDQKTLPDGRYSYQLEVVDAAGNSSKTRLKSILINTTPPDIKITADPALFSPKPTAPHFSSSTMFVLGYQDVSPVMRWKVIIQDPMKNNVRVFSGTSSFPRSISWYGRSSARKILPDGPYTYTLFAEDDVGNKATTSEQILRLDGSSPQVTLSANPALFSPGTDSQKNETTLLLGYKAKADISKWKLTIDLKKGEVARVFSGLGRPPQNIPWDGKNAYGRVLPDGTYDSFLKVIDEVGNEGMSPPAKITIDTSKPVATVVAQTEQLEDLSVPLTVTKDADKDIVISLASEVLFDSGKATLKDAADNTLLRAAYLIKRYPHRAVLINGYTDNVPIHDALFKNNQQLSKARAEAVMKFLAFKANIPASRMKAQGFGDKNPIASNDDPEGRQKNRRVEIVLTSNTQQSQAKEKNQ